MSETKRANSAAPGGERVSYAEYWRQLGPLETFEPAVFVGDDQTPQSVCNLMLALAMVHNDLRDIVVAIALLKNADPVDRTTHTTELGQFSGLFLSCRRALVGVT